MFKFSYVNRVDSDHAALTGAAWSGSTLFGKALHHGIIRILKIIADRT